jgi:hypothetical protein
MSNIDTSRQAAWDKMQADAASRHVHAGLGLPSGGGGGTYDGMEARVAALEGKFDRIEAKLDGLVSDVSSIRADVAEIKGKLSGLPNAYEFGQLKGRVDSLPTTAKVGTIVAIAVGIVTLVLRWPEVAALLAR